MLGNSKAFKDQTALTVLQKLGSCLNSCCHQEGSGRPAQCKQAVLLMANHARLCHQTFLCITSNYCQTRARSLALT